MDRNYDDDEEDESFSSAALLRWTSLILGDVLNSSFASVEEFMRSSSRHRRPRFDLRLCDALQRLHGEVPSFEGFLSRGALLLQLLTQSNLVRKLRAEVAEEGEDSKGGSVDEKAVDETFRQSLVRSCSVEEAQLTGDLLRLLFESMEHDMAFSASSRDRASLEFDNKMALASATRNAQWLTRVRHHLLTRDSSVVDILRPLIKS